MTGRPTKKRAHRILLVGMMGTGKSTVGRELSTRLGWPLLDSDAEIIRSTGLSVPEIWAQRGEPAFRAEEARVLQAATTSDGPVIISVAGGAVLDPDNRRRIRAAGLIVWLRAEAKTIIARVGAGAGRPLLTVNPAEAIVRLERERRPLYQALADVVVDVDHRSPADIALAIQSALATDGA